MAKNIDENTNITPETENFQNGVEKPKNLIDIKSDDGESTTQAAIDKDVEKKSKKQYKKSYHKTTDEDGEVLENDSEDPSKDLSKDDLKDPSKKEEPKKPVVDPTQAAIDKRINKIVAKQKEAEEKYNKLLQEHEALKNKIPETNKEEQGFETYEELFEHLYEKKQKAENENRQKLTKEQQAQQDRNAKLVEKLQEADKLSPGLIAEIQASPLIDEFPRDLEEFVRDSDVGPHIIRKFINNEDLLDKYKELSEKGKDRMLLKMELELESTLKNPPIHENNEEEVEENDEPETPIIKKQLITKPISPIRNSTVTPKKFFKNALDAAEALTSKELSAWMKENYPK